MENRSALVVGATGIVGGNLCERLLADGWRVYALARRPEAAPKGVVPLQADLNDRERVFRGDRPSAGFTCIPDNLDAGRDRGGSLRDQRPTLDQCSRCRACGTPPLSDMWFWSPASNIIWDRSRISTNSCLTRPFREDTPRLPLENFYYPQEDVLFEAATRDGFTWSVHRPNNHCWLCNGLADEPMA